MSANTQITLKTAFNSSRNRGKGRGMDNRKQNTSGVWLVARVQNLNKASDRVSISFLVKSSRVEFFKPGNKFSLIHDKSTKGL